MGDVYQREFVLPRKSLSASTPGFSQKSINKLVDAKAPINILNIEANHIKRVPGKEHPNGIVPLLEYQLWLEAGKMPQVNYKSEKNDPNFNFNSNVWRNFRTSAGFDTIRKGNVSESISALYPINIPAPSKVGGNTLASFFQQNKRNFFKTEKSYEVAMSKVRREEGFMKYLRLKSEVRNPPLDVQGNIVPPNNFKKYPSLNLPATFFTQTEKELNETQEQSRLDETFNLNRRGPVPSVVSQKNPITPSKISYRDSHPDYDRFIVEQHLKGNYGYLNTT